MASDYSRHTIPVPSFPQPSQPLKRYPAAEIATFWLSRFEAALNNNPSQLSLLLHPNVWWRDHLALSWDYHTLSTLPTLQAFLIPRLAKLQFSNLRLRQTGRFAPSYKNPAEGLEWIESMIEFETRLGRGTGMIRLVQDTNGAWKGFLIYTALSEIRGHEEATGCRRPHGGNNSLLGGVKGGNWFERRSRQKDFLDSDPTVFIIGAGQAGLNIAARLQALNISCLLVDRNKRVGDNWRNRYRTLVTHDPVHTCHMAYLPFPRNWPFFTPKDKLGDWFEAYASIMELNVWTGTTISKSSYNEKKHVWTVTVQREDGTQRTLKPRHVIFCTGHSGEPKIPTFPGQDTFKGTVYHGSQHRDASQDAGVHGKKVIVVGTGNSGHDIAQNYCENGASVTMLQRSSTYVISASKGLLRLAEGLFDEDGPPTEEADVYSQSIPSAVSWALSIEGTKKIAEEEKEMLHGLRKAGFQLNPGIDGSGIFRTYMQKGGGYYIDVGCSRLIVDGKIKMVHSPRGISGFKENMLVLADGKELEADVVVLATGYDNMRTSLRKALGDKVADQCKDVWDVDEEGEVNAMWRPSGHPGLWYMGGNLSLCRVYSKFLALQIKAIEEGLNEDAAENRWVKVKSARL